MITWKKETFMETELARINSYQASLPGSVEVARVMYGALATQVFDWEYCRLSVIFELLGMPPFQKSAVFFNIVQKAFDPPPLLFEHLSYFAGGIF